MPTLRSLRLALLVALCLVVAAVAGGCGSGNSSSFPDGGADGSTTTGATDASLHDSGGTSLLVDGTTPTGVLAISPLHPAITVPYGTHAPTVTFKATSGGVAVAASFTIDLAHIGTMSASTGVFTPGGKLGGTANVTATFGAQKATTTVSVTVTQVDNGAPVGLDAGGGIGGNGGVGGAGPGGKVSAAGQTVLKGTPIADTGLAWLYPYDKTVWPRGLLAPLLQWQPGAVGAYDAVYIHLQEKGFDYQGFFGAPATPFVNHPLLQAAWDALSFSNQGDPVAVTLVFSSGGKAYGPLKETWTIAQGTLTGTVYYNSYGTALAQNYCCTSAGAQFGGATLAIRHGATSPTLVAGSTGGAGQCRVCHSVAARGATLVTQHGDNYQASSAYALTAGNAETPMPTANNFGFAAISPDGTFLFTNGGGSLPATSADPVSGLFSIPSGAPIPSTGLPAGLGGATPSFSPDGAHVAFNYYTSDQASLAAIDFQQATSTFSNLQTLNTPASGTRDLFPAFLPTSDAVIFEHEVANDGEFGATRNGSRGELWWVDLKTHNAVPLATLNGAAYLPTGGTNHTADGTLDYEPTVNPVASGGYAWVVFTSRRLYGNVATQDPFLSDPRDYDPSASATTKKLWVAAIDLNAPPGSDPSHPAFYLPGQELLAGNSRGYWVVDPCEKAGQSCETGDQCCTGYCAAADGGSVCGAQPAGCSTQGNKCTATTDCCGASSGVQCIDGFCAASTPR